MPFFRGRKKITDRKIKNASLQVRIPLKQCGPSEKRVCLSVSRGLPAVMTVEAALALSLFLFIAVTLAAPLKMLDTHRKIQAKLDAVCAKASQYLAVPGLEEVPFSKAGFLLYAMEQTEPYLNSCLVESFSFLRSRVMSDDESVDLVLDYQMRLPIPIFHLKSLPMTARSRRRAWVGRDGGKKGEEDRADDGEEMVYVGRDSTRYHRNGACHYFYHDLNAVPFDSIKDYRNESGKKYHPCSRCGKSASSGGTVYILPEGESYHSGPNCSSLNAYVKTVPLREVEYLGACSYCSPQ